MIYTIRHVTRYYYPKPVRESVMEVRKHPQTCNVQRCVNFSLMVQPEVRLFRYVDHLGNQIYHFDVPWSHQDLMVTAESVLEVKPNAERPEVDVSGTWENLDRTLETRDCFDMLLPSTFVNPVPAVDVLAQQLGARRRDTPYGVALDLTRSIHSHFVYDRSITKVDSPVEVAIDNKRGVCQDFAHVLLALLRSVGLPCRYVSGYNFRHTQSNDGPAERTSHAWVEALIPDGNGDASWIGFDPTLGSLADDRHIRTCVGRDYADVPPTRGVYRGGVVGQLSYAVQVHSPDELVQEDEFQTLT